jgi:RNA polymerase sigma-70 factor (ECF subfamily)
VESTDSLLVARLAAGDDRALTAAFDSFGSAVHMTALRALGDPALAEDVVQDVFVNLWLNPDRFDERLGSLRTYMMLCARHRAQDLLRGELRRHGREARYQRLIPAQREATPGEKVTDAATQSAVREAVRSLPPDQREAVELAYFGGLSYRDVARTVGIAEGTAKSRVRLALAKLGAMLDRELLEPS